jgi:hypothetical protein
MAARRQGIDAKRVGRMLTLLVSDIIFKGFFVDVPSDASNCGEAAQERPIFYCYYLIPGLNRFRARSCRFESWIN